MTDPAFKIPNFFSNLLGCVSQTDDIAAPARFKIDFFAIGAGSPIRFATREYENGFTYSDDIPLAIPKAILGNLGLNNLTFAVEHDAGVNLTFGWFHNIQCFSVVTG